ncbi:MAG: DUF2190 family protein [Gammaproteobacteria bacterium]|nr:DUF2190 family protein [Gammaproteobacteria bacterium]
MSKNHVQPGNVIAVPLGATFASGDLIAVGTLAGVVLEGGSSGQTRSVAIDEVYRVPKRTAAVFAIGAIAYLDAANKRLDDTDASGANIRAGRVTIAAGNGTTTVDIKLNA